MRSLLIVGAALLGLPPAGAVNKCVNAEGDQISYSDAPCRAETQPVDARDNTVHRNAADMHRLQAAEAQARQRALAELRQQELQSQHALQMKRAAEAAEQARAARNAQVVPIIPRTPTFVNPTVQNPVAPGPGFVGYPR